MLRNNYQQTLALSLAQRRGLEDLGFQQRLMQTLEKRGLLDRAVEYLPDDMVLADRRKRNVAADAAGTRGAARLRQADALRRLARIESAGRSVSRPRTGPLFPQGDDGTFPEALAEHTAAPRDHRHATRQFDDQSRRPHADRAHRRPDRRHPPSRSPPPSPPCATATTCRRSTTRSTRSTTRFRAKCNSRFMPRSKTCCSTGWSGSCAMSI